MIKQPIRCAAPAKTKRQAGMASIVITMVTMVIISLIVVGFATVSRREQRQSLDQLQSSQAFYAAESGVEDARSIIKQAAKTGQPIIAKETCNEPGGPYPSGDQTIVDQSADVSYTCLKVDPSPTSLEYDGVGESSLVVPVKTDQPMTSVRITWTPATPPSGSPAATCPSSPTNSFTPQTKWDCGYAVLRADLVPTEGALTRTGLGNGLASAYFVPIRSGASGQLNYGSATGRANVVAANCDTTSYGKCTATITGLNVRSASLRLSSVYQQSRITVEALNGSNPQGITGAQAVIDSTGRATDVLRRIKVRLPIVETGGLLPAYALNSNGAICKRFSVAPGYFSIPGDIINADDKNDMCLSKQDGNPGGGPVGCTVTNEIAFALDTSNSMTLPWDSTTRNAEMRSVTRKFVAGSDISSARNHAAIVPFNTNASVTRTLTGDQTALNNAVNAMGNSAGTNYLAALDSVRQEFASSRVRLGAGKVMVFMSDGSPSGQNGSDATAAEKNQIRNRANLLKSQGVVVYTIGIGSDDPSQHDPIDEQLLIDMSGNGGTYTDAHNRSQLRTIMDQISDNVTCDTASAPPSTACSPAASAKPPRQTCYYYYGLRNTSYVPANNDKVVGCRWNVSDGTVYNDTACRNGEQFVHTFAKLANEKPFPQSCNAVGATFNGTIKYSNGLPNSASSASSRYPFCFDADGDQIDSSGRKMVAGTAGDAD